MNKIDDWRLKPRAKTSKIWAIPIKELSAIIADAKSVSDVLLYFGLNNIGGNYKTLMRRCEADGINYDHIPKGLDSNTGKKFKSNSPISDEDIFCVNCKHGQGSLRIKYRRIVEYRCKICGNRAIWQGRDMVLILDHINGIRNDNRMENLRWLCPNCNSQTPTFAGRNNSNKNAGLSRGSS